MRNYNAQLEQIQLLVDRICNHRTNSSKSDKYSCDKLLALSEEYGYFYGQAIAHVYLAQYYQKQKNDDFYHFHLNKTRDIAKSRNYFDVMILYFKLTGLNYINANDELAALTMYFSGLDIASVVKDNKAFAVFNNNIAEIFYRTGAYEDARKFYTMALEAAEKIEIKDPDCSEKMILINMMHLSCIQGEIEEANIYREKCSRIKEAPEHIELLFQEEEIYILFTENQEQEVYRHIEQLKEKLLHTDCDTELLEDVYFMLMELLLHVKHEEYGRWCLERIQKLYRNTSLNHALQIQKFHIQYADMFGLVQDELYKAFYDVSSENKMWDSRSAAESFKNQIALYEMKKERRFMEQERRNLQNAIDRDELTGIYNRRYFNKLVSKLHQNETLKSLGCLMIDVDYFKEYNNYYGHLRGDQILREVASILHEELPKYGYAVRYGGDEFFCLFPNSSVEEVIIFVKAVQKKLKNKNILHVKSKVSFVLTLSFGICCITHKQDLEESVLIKMADTALYEAKRNGRNTYAVYTERRTT